MSTLLIQSCSARKRDVDGEVPAIDLYDGYFYRIIHKARREGAFDPSIEMRILSAKYGLLSPEEEIEPYDQQMDVSRATDLRESVVDEICAVVNARDVDEVTINASKTYERALAGLEARVDVPVTRISGEGIGVKGSQLKQFIRGRDVTRSRLSA